MLLTITTTHVPATDLGYLLHKHPDKFQTVELSVGNAHIFYPEKSEERTTICLLLDIDPIDMVRNARNLGGEGFALGDLEADSIPVNFLMPFDGTPLEGTWLLTPLGCLRILALVRLACPQAELRMAGGREMHLRTQQPAALQVANSIFLGDYLTSEGQAAAADLAMIADAGFVVLGQEDVDPNELARRVHASKNRDARQPATGCGGGCASTCGTAGTGCPIGAAGPAAGVEPVLRRRGAGTTESPNA